MNALTAVMNRESGRRQLGSYFGAKEYITTDVKRGTARNRSGARLLALTDDFVRGLWIGLEEECGEASDEVLRTCGKVWGGRLMGRFAKDLSEFYGQPVEQFPMGFFDATVKEAFARHGWGDLSMDYTYHASGLIGVDLRHPPMAEALGKRDRPSEPVMAGALAGMFSHVAGQELDCHQTECPSKGDPLARFVLGLADRLEEVPGWVEEGRRHAEILRNLCDTRA